MAMLRVGSRGEQVRQIQIWLGLDADGIYGKQTASAVKSYQARNGLSVDGLVGPVTLAHMRASFGAGTGDGDTIAPPVPEYGVPIYANGEIAVGHLDPTAVAVKFSTDDAILLRLPDDAIDPDKLNRDFRVKGDTYCYNPFLKADLKAADGTFLIPPYTSGSDLFRSKTIVPLGQFLAGAAQSQSTAFATALEPLVKAVPKEAVLERPAHQFNMGDRVDNRVIFFGGSVAHREIDALTAGAGRQNMRLMKEWVHFSDIPLTKSAQGGRIADILGNEYTIGGGSHLGALSLGARDGRPLTVKSDWGDFEDPSDKFPQYGLHLLAIDYQAGVTEPIPTATLAAYKHNADMWDCFAAMVAPFHTDHLDHGKEDREKFNALELSLIHI